MSERTKAILSAVTIVACLALMGFLVHEKADGAAVGAIAVVTTVVAWLTRTPGKTDPPSGASIVPLVGIGTIAALLLGGCALFEDKALQAETSYRAQQLKCVDQYETKSEIDACRAKVREEWGVAEVASRKDGGQ
jgi:hypothetical protein